jgi:hypothetical protein
VYVAGDSNADQFSEAAIGSGKLLGRPVTISTFNGCSFIGASWSDQTDPFKQHCREYVQGTLRWLAHAKPGLVIIGMSDSLWIVPHIAVGPTREAESAKRESKVPYLEDDLRSVVSQLQNGGQKVLMMQPIPKPQRLDGAKIKILFDPARCSTLSVLRAACPKPVATPRAYADRLQADPRRTIRRVAAKTGASVLDLRDYFCSLNMCLTHRGRLPLYRDGGHITVGTSTALAQTFSDAIREQP